MLTRKIKGGVTVDLMGVDAFLPGSQIALRRVPNIEDLIGETYDFKIIKLNKRRRNIVVSRRVLLEAEREVKREKLKKELEVGQVRKGVVKNITDFGAFIDLGGMDGLLHITDMSWGRVGHPSEVVRSATSWTSRSSTSTGSASASRSASSSSRTTPGPTSTRSTRSAPASAAGWSRSPTTAPSSSWRRASRAWSTSPR
jgi:hypothetical protein